MDIILDRVANIQDTGDLFDYLHVITSIILGIGLADILTGIGSYIRNRDKIKLDWSHNIWVAMTFLAIIQNWWGLWRYRYQDYSFETYMLEILIATTYYLMARIVLPDFSSSDVADVFREINKIRKNNGDQSNDSNSQKYIMASYYFRNVTVMSFVTITVIALLALQDSLLTNVENYESKQFARFILAFMIAIMGFSAFIDRYKRKKNGEVFQYNQSLLSLFIIKIHFCITSLFAISFAYYIVKFYTYGQFNVVYWAISIFALILAYLVNFHRIQIVNFFRRRGARRD